MARPKRGEILSLTIDDLAFGGEGVGRADGYVVFVPGALPGDRLQVRLVQVRSRFGRGVIEAVLEPSPQRVEAPCPYFGRCGGCRLQHVAYEAQLTFKSKQVVDALERLGGLRDVPLRPIIGADEIFGYRNKME
ncbi:MAG TPA: TRAM domain-containing protein, partial [Candidatus Eisenbacteria bacterium]|nr:TRAM domain-containing protein [Candidatus Eisenbacteria bacterium]